MESLAEHVRRGEPRALARTITMLESGAPDGQVALAKLRREGTRGHVVGITGAPGSGKSTLTDKVIAAARKAERTVAVVAVDPSSPYTGGAVLGDRIRMTRWHDDPGVYIRSMATRGHLGGLTAATLQVVALLDAVGFDLVLVETVGVGQSEVDVVRVADTTVLVLTPGAGDAVQAFKAGVMEIADVFAVNKFDLPGGPKLVREIRALLELDPEDAGWRPRIVETVASQDDGTPELMDAISAHRAFLASSGAWERRRRERVRFELAASVGTAVRALLAEREEALIDAIAAGELTSTEAVRRVLPGALNGPPTAGIDPDGTDPDGADPAR